MNDVLNKNLMKYYLPLLLLCMILLTACDKGNGNIKNSLGHRNLNGNIEEIKLVTYGESISEGLYRDADIDVFTVKKDTYNKDGMLIKTEIFNGQNEFQLGYTKKYKNNRLYQETNLNPDFLGNVQMKVEYSNDYLKETRINLNSNGEETIRSIKEYDVNRNLLSLEYWLEGKFIKGYSYIYDDKQNMVMESSYTPTRKLEYEVFYDYDEKGNVVFERRKNNDDFMNYEIIRSYDKNNNVTKEIKKIRDYIEYTKSFEYEYDKNNNWTSKEVIKGNELIEKQFREISYY